MGRLRRRCLLLPAPGGRLGPTGITVGPNGLVYVCDTWGHRILVFGAPDGIIRSLGDFGDTRDAADPTVEPGRFYGPRDVAVAGEEIYVVDTGNERVQVFGLDGAFRRAFGGYGSALGQLIEPVGIAVAPDGRVYVADSGNGRISVFTTDGTPVAQWPVAAWAGQRDFEPYLALGTDGTLYATSSATGSIEVFDTADGRHRASITVVAGRRLEAPVGITVDPDGAIVITDRGIGAIVRSAPEGLPEGGLATPAR